MARCTHWSSWSRQAIVARLDNEIPEEFAQALRELRLIADERVTGVALTGGVSSDIWRIDTARGPLCAKRALPKLRVAADWRAPIERNRYEARWMAIANEARPGCAPRVLGQHAALGVLIMDYLPSPAYRLWKPDLRDGLVDLAVARDVGATLGQIHRYAAHRPQLAGEFDTDAIFFDIRLEPYLLATASRHPDLADALQQLVQVTRSHLVSLVHGDVSPKNILIGPHGPVLLDAECAWWGDPAFDIAFCLNHLLLKCLWNPAARDALLGAFETLANAYLEQIDWEPRVSLEQRASALLPGLLLARVDGKSPVEYLTSDLQRDAVRHVARTLLRQAPARLADVAAAWRTELAR